MGCIGSIVRTPVGLVLGVFVFIGAVLAGRSAILVFAGQGFCYAGDGWVASDQFCAAALGVGAVAAFLAGFTAMRIGGTAATVLLCLLIGALGVLDASGSMRKSEEVRFADRPEDRPKDQIGRAHV